MGHSMLLKLDVKVCVKRRRNPIFLELIRYIRGLGEFLHQVILERKCTRLGSEPLAFAVGCADG